MALDAYTKFLSHFNGSDTNKEIVDSGVTGHTATLVGTAQTSYKGSLYLNDSTNYISTPNNADFRFGTGDFTVEAWIWIDPSSSTNYYKVIASQYTHGTGEQGWFFAWYSGALWFFQDSSYDYWSRPFDQDTATWYHVAVVRYGNALKFFVNGVQSGTDADVTGISFNDSSAVFAAGACPSLSVGGYTAWGGCIDELRVIKGTAKYTANFTPQTTPFSVSDDANTKILLHMDGPDQSTTFIDECGNTMTAQGSAKIVFDPTKVSPICKFGTNSFYMDGNSDYATIPNHDDWKLGSGDFTIDAWVRYSSLPSSSGMMDVVSFWQGNAQNHRSWIFGLRNSSGTMKWEFQANPDGTSGSTVQYQFTANTISAGVWYHVALVRYGNMLICFQDGVAVGSSSFTMTLYSSSTAKLAIGADNVDGTPEFHMHGYIDELRISKGIARWTGNFTPPTAEYTASSEDVFLSHFNGTDGDMQIVDSGNTGHIVTANSGANTASGGSIYFNGSSIVYPAASSDFSFSGDFTYEGWVYCDSTGVYMGLFGYSDVYYNAQSMYLVAQYNSLLMRTNYPVGGGIAVSGGASFTPNAWNHFALVRNGSYITGYVNGIGGTPVSYTGTVGESGTPMYIGRMTYASNNYWLTGYLDEIRVSNCARYTTSTFTVPTQQFAYDSNTKLLIHTDRDSITDAAGHSLTVSSAVSDRTKFKVPPPKKFGNASLFLDGSSQYLSVPDHADWDIFASNSDDWTIDHWIKLDASMIGNQFTIASHTQGMVPNYFWWWQYWGTGYGWSMRANVNSVDIFPTGAGNWFAGGEITDQDWHHVAYVKKGSTHGIYLDGQQVAYCTMSTTMDFSASLKIGQDGYPASPQWFKGYLDDFRIVHSNIFNANPNSGKTDTITVPTAALVSDSNTKLLLHMNSLDEASGVKPLTFNGGAQLDTTINKFGTSNPTVTTDGSYTVVKYTSSGSIKFKKAGTVRALVVAGGAGGGGATIYGAGGAGGVIEETSHAVSAGSYAITVGAGGRAGIYGGQYPGKGGDSIFDNIHCYGGGTWTGSGDLNGGCGAGGYSTGSMPGGSGVPGQGYNGGHGSDGTYGAGGGGGGAGEAGEDRYNSGASGGSGGDGKQSDITGTNTYYGGGGGGGCDTRTGGSGAAGGQGGGGAANSPGSAGTNGLGGGGGGGMYTGSYYDGGAGGSGVVIIRYLTSDDLLDLSGASLLLDGTGDYVTVPDSDDWALGSEDFTIDCWVRLDALPDESDMQIVGSYYSTSNKRGWKFNVYESSGDYKIDFQYSTTGSDSVHKYSSAISISTGVWYHLAAVRSGNLVYLFKDGVVVGIGDMAGVTIYDCDRPLYIGYEEGGAGTAYLNGRIDELRVSKGIARWTSNFTPPTSSYSSPDSYSKLLLHMNSLDVAGYKQLTFSGNAQLDTANSQFGTKSPTITYDGAYTVATFSSSGKFRVENAGEVEVLLVGGGGSGGGGQMGTGGAGGGGGGGVVSSTVSVTSQTYTITVGSGGTAAGEDLIGNNGNNSTALGLTAYGGGGGGSPSVDSGAGEDGANGGGGAGTGGDSGHYGTGTQGYNGGHGHYYGGGGGGGGGSAVGSDGYQSGAGGGGGNGGAGVSSSITGSSVTYGGGGGGGNWGTAPTGAGGSGGGGAAGYHNSYAATAGTDGLGGGGGGAVYGYTTSGKGGDGVVILRYLTSDNVTGDAAALTLDGTGDYVSVTDSDDWDFGEEQFTIDFWIYPNSIPYKTGSYYKQLNIISQRDSTTSYWSLYLVGITGTRCDLNWSVNNSNIGGTTLAGELVVGAWNHIAVVSGASIGYIYINGVAFAGFSPTTMPNLSSTLKVGYNDAVYDANTYEMAYLDGYIDELRISKGVARWTSNFTPPTREYGEELGGFPTFFGFNF